MAVSDDRALLQLAKAEAFIGLAEGGIPIGAAVVVGGKVLGAGHNRRVQLGSPIRHGETDALEIAGRQPASVYRRSTMVTTLSPCDMCTGAILLYEIPRVVVGENRTFTGGEELLRSRGVEVVVLDDAECVAMMAGLHRGASGALARGHRGIERTSEPHSPAHSPGALPPLIRRRPRPTCANCEPDLTLWCATATLRRPWPTPPSPTS